MALRPSGADVNPQCLEWLRVPYDGPRTCPGTSRPAVCGGHRARDPPAHEVSPEFTVHPRRSEPATAPTLSPTTPLRARLERCDDDFAAPRDG